MRATIEVGDDGVYHVHTNGNADRLEDQARAGDDSNPGANCTERREVTLVCGADIQPEPISWLWGGWLAGGKFHVLAGPPGTGKTTLALAMAATISIGGRWPDASIASVGNVLVWSGEDDPRDTLIPRLIASGADMARVFFVEGVIDGDEHRPFDPASDTQCLLRAAAKIGDVRLLIVDPIVSAVGGDSHKNGEVRRGLQPLVDLGAALGCAVLGISHFSKGTAARDPVERVTGSIAFGALARIVMGAVKRSDEDGGGRLIVRAKSNIGPDSGGFEYDLSQCELKGYPGVTTSHVLWGGAVEGEARNLLGQPDSSSDADKRSELEDAKGFLRNLLADGPVKSTVINTDSRGAGHSWATIRRAQKELGIEPFKEGMKGGWFWQLPRRRSKVVEDAEGVHKNSVSTFGKSEHLRDDDAEVF